MIKCDIKGIWTDLHLKSYTMLPYNTIYLRKNEEELVFLFEKELTYGNFLLGHFIKKPIFRLKNKEIL